MYKLKVLDKSPKEYEKISDSLSRYIKFVLFENTNIQINDNQSKNEILLLPTDEKIWNDNNIDLASNNTLLKLEAKGILFFTTEELSRGDDPQSFYNKSRMIRSFFERTTYAKTANHKNIFNKIRELILEIEGGKNGNKLNPSDAITQLVELKEKIPKLEIYDKFCKKNVCKPDKCEECWEEMQELYTYVSFHTITSHQIARDIEDSLFLRNKEDLLRNKEDFFKKSLNFRYGELLYDLAFTVAWNPRRIKNEELKILIIDDNPKGVFKKWKDLLKLLPDSTTAYITTRKSWKEFEKKDFWSKLYQCPSNKNDTNCKIDLVKIVKNNKEFNESDKETNFLLKNNKFEFTHIVIDLLFGNYNEGNRIIREFVRFRHKLSKEKGINAKFDIIALSLSEEIEDIHRSLQEGAVTFVSKRRIYSLPGVIARLEEGRKILPGQKSVIAKYRNFGKLYNLPEEMKRKLRTEPFAEFADKGENKKYLNKLSKYLANDWIKKIPKAELHFHIGGSMNANIVFNLALNNLLHKKEKWEDEKKNTGNVNRCVKFNEFIDKSIEQLSPLIRNFGNKKDKEYEVFIEEKKEFENLISGKNFEKDVYAWLEKEYDEKENNNDCKKFLIEESLSIGKPKEWKNEISKINAEELIFKFKTWQINNNLSCIFKQDEIKEDDIISLFIILIGILEGKKEDDIKDFWELTFELKEEFGNELNRENQTISSFYNALNKLAKCNLKKLIKVFEQIKDKINNNLKKARLDNTLHSLISAEKRKGSLKDYLRGSIFCGSLHLQYYENIFACVAHLIKEASDDNIRYLEIRVSPEGYIKEDLTTQESIQALFDGADLMSYYLYKKEKFIWTNFLITGKRHKTPEKLAIEISSAVTNRERTIQRQEYLKKIKEKLPNNKLTTLGYEWKPSRIAGVDLAGEEKGYSPAQFVEDFAPLFKTCSYLTVHAGEEGTAQNIWEAIYKLNAHRIGHGLNLIKHPFLLELARNTQICLEMAPISNIFTNPNLNEKYPLYDYIKEGICVTINTDDKAWSDSTLSNEYVKGAELYWKRSKNKNIEDEFEGKFLTKWEILRIVKNGFKKSFISREEKRDLLKAVEEEIYQLILMFNRIEKEKYYL